MAEFNNTRPLGFIESEKLIAAMHKHNAKCDYCKQMKDELYTTDGDDYLCNLCHKSAMQVHMEIIEEELKHEQL